MKEEYHFKRGAMSVAVSRKRSLFEEQQISPLRSKRMCLTQSGSPIRSPGQAERIVTDGQVENVTQHVQSESEEWVEHLVKEMMSASDLNDARVRGKNALEAVEKVFASRSSMAIEGMQKENVDLKEKLQVSLRESHILKRAVAIQHERQLKHEGLSQELQQAKQVIAQYQEQVRMLELNNYSLRMHLRMAQESTTMSGRFHPDVF